MSHRPPIRILIADDDGVSLEILRQTLEAEGHHVECVTDGIQAWERLTGDGPRFDVILLDWMMPRMDGLEVLAAVKDDPELAMTPVILETARAERSDIRTGIAAGAYYYITKPLDVETVCSAVRTAAEDHKRYINMRETLRQGISAAETLDEATFRFRTDRQALGLATLLSQAFPDPERAVTGLSELLLNAVEHGNLGITYEEKSALLESGAWKEEITRRLAAPENISKWVDVRFERNGEEAWVLITDQGEGFEWAPYLTVSPDRVFDSHGRGIAMANLQSFDRLEYRPPGNQVLAAIGIRPSTA